MTSHPSVFYWPFLSGRRGEAEIRTVALKSERCGASSLPLPAKAQSWRLIGLVEPGVSQLQDGIAVPQLVMLWGLRVHAHRASASEANFLLLTPNPRRHEKWAKCHLGWLIKSLDLGWGMIVHINHWLASIILLSGVFFIGFLLIGMDYVLRKKKGNDKKSLFLQTSHF